MRLRPRESGSSTFTLERPAALFRDAQSNMLERIVPWLKRASEQLLTGIRSARDEVTPWLMRSGAYLRRSAISLHQRAIPWLRQTGSYLRERSISARDRLVPWLARTHAQLRESTRDLRANPAPRLRAARERLEQRTLSGVDRVRPWLARARVHGRKRVDTFRAAAQAKRKAGVPIWAAALLVIVAALTAQAVAHQSVERRHELETRQLTRIYQSEQAASQARAADALVRESDETYRLLGTTIAWTIGTELARKKDSQLDLYFHELTKNGRIDLIVFADAKGKVMAASDPGMRGADFVQHFPAALLQETTVAIHRGAGSTNRLVMPVQRFGVRLGTAMLVYKVR
jgi:hypothetical protein